MTDASTITLDTLNLRDLLLSLVEWRTYIPKVLKVTLGSGLALAALRDLPPGDIDCYLRGPASGCDPSSFYQKPTISSTRYFEPCIHLVRI